MRKNVDSKSCEKLTGAWARWRFLYSGYWAVWERVTKAHKFLKVSLHRHPVGRASLLRWNEELSHLHACRESKNCKSGSFSWEDQSQMVLPSFGGRNVLWIVTWGSAQDGVHAFRKRKRVPVPPTRLWSDWLAELGYLLVPHSISRASWFSLCGIGLFYYSQWEPWKYFTNSIHCVVGVFLLNILSSLLKKKKLPIILLGVFINSGITV